MRYIIAETPQGDRQPFIGLAPTTHADLAAFAATKGFTRVTSAAFFHPTPEKGVAIHYRSEGLNLGPGPDDARILWIYIRATLDLVPGFSPRPVEKTKSAPAAAKVAEFLKTQSHHA